MNNDKDLTSLLVSSHWFFVLEMPGKRKEDKLRTLTRAWNVRREKWNKEFFKFIRILLSSRGWMGRIAISHVSIYLKRRYFIHNHVRKILSSYDISEKFHIWMIPSLVHPWATKSIFLLELLPCNASLDNREKLGIWRWKNVSLCSELLIHMRSRGRMKNGWTMRWKVYTNERGVNEERQPVDQWNFSFHAFSSSCNWS